MLSTHTSVAEHKLGSTHSLMLVLHWTPDQPALHTHPLTLSQRKAFWEQSQDVLQLYPQCKESQPKMTKFHTKDSLYAKILEGQGHDFG